MLIKLMVCPPIKDPNPIPRLKMPEKIDIATELVFSFVANIVSDWQATLNAVELVPHTIHINNSVIMDAALGFNKNKTSVRENSETKMNLFLFLL